jgi:hypothetical protein
MEEVIQNIYYASFEGKDGLVDSNVTHITEEKVPETSTEPLVRLKELEQEIELKLEELQSIKEAITSVKEISQPG